MDARCDCIVPFFDGKRWSFKKIEERKRALEKKREEREENNKMKVRLKCKEKRGIERM